MNQADVIRALALAFGAGEHRHQAAKEIVRQITQLRKRVAALEGLEPRLVCLNPPRQRKRKE